MTQATALQANRPSPEQPKLENIGAIALTQALNDAAHTATALFSPTGAVYDSDVTFRKLTSLNGSAATATLETCFPQSVAKERKTLIDRVLQTRTPLVVGGMLHGTWTYTTYRPLGSNGTSAILSTTTFASEAGSPASQPIDADVEAEHHDLGALAVLTEREMQVLRLIGLGLSTAEMSDTLHRSVKTIEGHRLSLGNKLSCDSKVELARISIAAGLTMLSHDRVGELARRGSRKRASSARSKD